MTELLAYILVLNAISGATSLTIIARRVQNQSPSFYRYKIYAPEQYLPGQQQQQQRVHRVPVHPPLIQESYRVPKYRHKHRYHVKSVKPVVYPAVVAQRPRPPAKKYREGRPLPAIVTNELDETKEEFEPEADLPPAPLEDEGSFPSFGKESPHRPIGYKRPGEWSTATPAAESGSTFTPLQMYLQVRQTNQVKHVPQSEALKDATTLEEVVNAPRLKELLRTTRVREVYSEEGYEDAGYDHGGHIRHAEHDEGYVAKDEGLIKIREKVEEEDYGGPQESRQAAQKRTRMAVEDETAEESQVEPKISRSRAEFSSLEFATLPPKYKGEHKYSSKIRSRVKEGEDGRTSFALPTTEMTTRNFWAVPTVFDGLPTSTSPMGFDVFSYAPTAGTMTADGSEKTTPRSKYIKIITSEEPGRSSTTQRTTWTNSSTSGGSEAVKVRQRTKGFKYSRLHAKYPKRDRFRLAKLNQPTTTLEPEEATSPADPEPDDKRIILPTIGYINSLTTAHFGKDKTAQVSNNNLLTTPLNLTQALNYLRSNKQGKIKDSVKSGSDRRRVVDEHVDVRVPTFEPMKLRKGSRSRRELGNEDEAEEEEREEDKPDDGEDVHDEKNAEIAEEERERIKAEREDRKRYEKYLKDEIDKEEEEILKATLGQYNAKDYPFGETVGRERTTEAAEEEEALVTTPKPIDMAKYPFYFSSRVHEDSPLRYATNPKNFPRKTGRGMEFYESRDRLVQCPEVVPNLEDIPKRNSTLESEGGDHQRLGDLGDKIACLRMKYFDEDPLDNPLFKEREVDYVGRIRNKPPKNEKNTKKEILKDNARKSRNSHYSVKENAIRDQSVVGKGREKARNNHNFRYHSSYQYQPNRTLHIMVKNQDERPVSDHPRSVQNGSERIIPVTEEVDEAPLQDYTTTYSKISGLTPPPLRRKLIRPTYRPFISPTAAPLKATPHRSKLIIPHNCLFVIGKMAALDGHKNLIIDCNDGMLIQELRNDVRYLKIIPKIPEVSRKDTKHHNGVHLRQKYTGPLTYEDSDWVPMTSYPSDSEITRFGRKTDEVVQVLNDHHNESEHYLITELKEEDGVRKGEVVEDTEHYASVMNLTASTEEPSASGIQRTRRKRAVKVNHKDEVKQKPKDLPLRLSLKEFFLYLQSNNERNKISPKPFQLPTTAKPPEESQEDAVVKIGSQYIKGTNGRELFYVRFGSSGVGRWVVSDVEEESAEAPTAKYSKKPLTKLYKKYGKGKYQ